MSDEEFTTESGFTDIPTKIYFRIDPSYLNYEDVFLQIIEDNGFMMNLTGELASEMNMKTCILLFLHKEYKDIDFTSLVRNITEDVSYKSKISPVGIIKLFNYVYSKLNTIKEKHEFIIETITNYTDDLCRYHTPVFPPGFILKFYKNSFENAHNIYTYLLYNCYCLLYNIYYNVDTYKEYINNIEYCIMKSGHENELYDIYEKLKKEFDIFAERKYVNYNLTFHYICTILSRLHDVSDMYEFFGTRIEQNNIDNFLGLYDNFMFKCNDLDHKWIGDVIELYIDNPNVRYMFNEEHIKEEYREKDNAFAQFVEKIPNIPDNNLIYIVMILKYIQWTRLYRNGDVLRVSSGETEDVAHDDERIYNHDIQYRDTPRFDNSNMISPVYNLSVCIEELFTEDEKSDVIKDGIYSDKFTLLSEMYEIILAEKRNKNIVFERMSFKDLLYDLDYSVDYTKIYEILQYGRNTELFPNSDIKYILPVRYERSSNIEQMIKSDDAEDVPEEAAEFMDGFTEEDKEKHKEEIVVDDEIHSDYSSSAEEKHSDYSSSGEKHSDYSSYSDDGDE